MRDWRNAEISAMRKFPTMMRLLRASVAVPVRAWLGGGLALRWHRGRFGLSERPIAPVKKNLRRVLLGLSLVFALAGLVVALSLTPAVQTQVARSVLARQPGLRSSLESVSASFGKAEVSDLRLQYDGAVLIVPSLTASLPVSPAVLYRDVRIRSLVVKGWTLDLSRRDQLRRVEETARVADTGGPTRAVPDRATASQRAEEIFRDLLNRWTLPAGVSIEALELDGTVLVPAGADMPAVRVHVVAKGGALAAGRECVFDVTAEAGLKGTTLPADAAALGGRVTAQFDAAGQLARIGLKSEVQAEGRAVPFPRYSVDLAAVRAADDVACTLAVAREGRTFARMSARFPTTAGPVRGEWQVDASAADVAPFLGRGTQPISAAAGEGTFAADDGILRVQASGDLKATVRHLGALLPALESLGEVTLASGFDLTCSADAVQVDRLRVAINGARPVATVRAAQPFRVKTGSGAIEPADPHADWLECSLTGLPAEWLAGRLPGWTFEYGDLAGAFAVRIADGGVALRSTEPLVAPAVSIRRAGRALAEKLDVSLVWQAEVGDGGWQVRCVPLTIGSAGRRLGSWDGTVAQPGGSGGAISVTGKWDADLDALAAERGISGFEGRSVAGEFTASFGRGAAFTGSVVIAGLDSAKAITASVQGRIGANGVGTFAGPIRFDGGDEAAELGLEGSLSGRSGAPLDLDLNAAKATLDQLRLLVAPAMAARSFLLTWTGGDSAAGTGAESVAPFWGDWLGRVRFSFANLKIGDKSIDNASGVLEIERDCLRLRNGRGDLAPKRPVQLEGTVAFERAASVPYRLNATGRTDKLEAAKLFPAPEPGAESVVSGRFALAAMFTGIGSGWDDLLAHAQQEYRLTSTTGIVRFLKTNLGGVNPETGSAVGDAMSGAATAVGRLFSVDKKRGSGDRSLTKNAQAVLGFSYDVAELGYSQARVTAIRAADGTWRLADIAMTSPDLVLAGTGRIAAAPGLPLEEQPLETELQIGLRGPLAARLAETGLLSERKDGEGYTALVSPVRFGGTMKQLDGRQWHDLLFDAARTTPPEKQER